MKILVVDDERAMTEAVKDNLVYEHFEVDTASGGNEALDFLKGERYDLIILDVMMPDMDGFEVLRRIQKAGDNTPVIFLTARAEDTDKIRGLGLGADDYITKPFNLKELIARVNAVLRRTAPGSELKSIRIGRMAINFTRQVIEYSGRSSCCESLGRYETAILRLLVSEPGKVFTRDEILDRIWGLAAYPTNRTIDNYIVKLRQKIETDPKNPRHLISCYGSGYKLVL